MAGRNMVEEEIIAEGRLVEAEMQNINRSVSNAPNTAGLSQAERVAQAVAAQNRLQELEDRLGRLQLLDEQIRRLRTTEQTQPRGATVAYHVADESHANNASE
eukprot:CAMPEP_0173459640 /NCGR_PEP_ID=MMETSP1357-20121228/61762_1 /TAXON_ID=77926 /ORGANISM="Hemiselmis rufescens, Strain PCC563" /LENGTH=102 /DNA_ID=CAMNT_0014427119 /DNA_START=1 /DNA_END=306 /DNA_ORIENTATION=+